MGLTAFHGPLSILAAMGCGRSYGKESRFLEKKISGIFQCGIWEALEKKKEIPTTAFVTDIGNDLAYEVPVERVAEWVEQCVSRLQALGAQVVISDLPLDALRTLGAGRYRFFRALLFPDCRLDWPEMLCRAESLSGRLRDLAAWRKTPLFQGKNDWYGWDPIHPRRGALEFLWRGLFACVCPPSTLAAVDNKSLALSLYLRGLRPQKWSAFSFSRCAEQPHGRLVDGSEIALF